MPFGITIDDVTPQDNTVTLREILTMKQIRVPIEEVGNLLRLITNNVESWESVIKRYPAFEHKEKENEQK